MANYCKLTFRGRDKNNREVVITKGHCSRCPAKLTAPRYIALYRSRLRPAEISVATKNLLNKVNVAVSCIDDMIFVYRRNYDKILKSLQNDLRNHIGNLSNVNKVYGRLAALTLQEEEIIEEIRHLAQEHGSDSPEVVEAFARYNVMHARIRQVNADTEIVGREFGQGIEIAGAIRNRINQAVAQVQLISVFYVEILGICQRVLDANGKNSDKKKKLCDNVLKEIGFEELKVQRDFINILIYKEEIDLAIQHFEVILSEGVFLGTATTAQEARNDNTEAENEVTEDEEE